LPVLDQAAHSGPAVHQDAAVSALDSGHISADIAWGSGGQESDRGTLTRDELRGGRWLQW
jgi:hypothetical protein